MSWVVASKIVLRVVDMIVDFVGRDYLKIEIRDPSGVIGKRGATGVKVMVVVGVAWISGL